MANHVIEVESGHYFVSPLFFVNYAEDFLEASNSHFSLKPFSPVKYYLVCHSIELSLKAYLLLSGVSKNDIRKRSLGHNLSNILEKCEELGIENIVQISNAQKIMLKELNEWYSRKGFEYFEVTNLVAGAGSLPDAEIAIELAALLISKLKEPCKDEANKP